MDECKFTDTRFSFRVSWDRKKKTIWKRSRERMRRRKERGRETDGGEECVYLVTGFNQPIVVYMGNNYRY